MHFNEVVKLCRRCGTEFKTLARNGKWCTDCRRVPKKERRVPLSGTRAIEAPDQDPDGYTLA